MNCHSIIGVLSAFLIIGSYALEYSLLEELGMDCPPRDSCIFVNANNASFANRSCECDSQCNDFRDCCIDRANLAPPGPHMTRNYFCMAYRGQHEIGVYVVDTCAPNYRASATVRRRCQEGDNFYIPLLSTPVTIVATNKTFKNRYCAECNGVAPSSLVTWDSYLNCPTLFPLHLNDSYIWENIKYNRSLMTWGVPLAGVFHKCEVIFNKPDNLTAVRFCRANAIDTCLPRFRSTLVERQCWSYSAVVYGTENAYKNPHCASCNDVPPNSLTCLDSALFIRNAKVPYSFALMWDVNPRHGDRVGVVEESCPTGQKYDPFSHKCRDLSCAFKGFKLVNGKCKKRKKKLHLF